MKSKKMSSTHVRLKKQFRNRFKSALSSYIEKMMSLKVNKMIQYFEIN